MTTTLITGGTGKSGRRVAARLKARGIATRVVARHTASRLDWGDDSTWPAVLEGVDSAYLCYYPDISYPGAAERVGAFARAAVAHGVRRLVLLSGRGEPDAVPAEDAVRVSGAAWTVLRSAWFMQNFSEHFLHQPVLEGVVALPAGQVAEPFLDVDDLAEVAVQALTSPGHAGATYELTGPRLLTFDEIAEVLSRVTRRTVRYLPVSPNEYAEAAREAGVPAAEVEPLTALFTRVLDGHNAFLTDDVARVLGRPPREFADYAREAAATGVWAVGDGLRAATR